MINQEFSIEFDILYNNISSNKAPGLNEYEKSVFLTKAQEEIVTELYTGRNSTQNSFEETEELRKYLGSLLKTTRCDKAIVSGEEPIHELVKEIRHNLSNIYGFYCEVSVYDATHILLLCTHKDVTIQAHTQDSQLIPNLFNSNKYYLFEIPFSVFNGQELTFTIKLPEWIFPEKSLSSINPASITLVNKNLEPLKDKSYFFTIPEDVMFITYEYGKHLYVKNNIPYTKEFLVYVTSQDELDKVYKNPFRGPSDTRVLRLDYDSSTIELISNNNIYSYNIKYIRKPNPIILADLEEDLSINGQYKESECELDSSLHRIILERAVSLALQTMYSK